MSRLPAHEFQWSRPNGELVIVPDLTRDELEQALCYMMEHAAEIEGLIYELDKVQSRWRDAK